MAAQQDITLTIEQNRTEPGVTALADTGGPSALRDRPLTDSLRELVDRRSSEVGLAGFDRVGIADVRFSFLEKFIADVLRQLADAVGAVKEASRALTDALAVTDQRSSDRGLVGGEATAMQDARSSELHRVIGDVARPMSDAFSRSIMVDRALTDVLRTLLDARSAARELVLAESAMRLLDSAVVALVTTEPAVVVERLLIEALAATDVLVDAHWAQYRSFPGATTTGVVR